MQESNPQTTKVSQWLIETLAGQYVDAIGKMTGQRPVPEWQPASRPAGPPATGTIVYLQPFRPEPEAALWIVAPEDAWNQIGSQILQAAGVGDRDREAIRGTFLEIVSQTSSALARILSTQLGKEVNREGGREAPLPAGSTEWFSFTLRFGETSSGQTPGQTSGQKTTSPFYVTFSEQLTSALQAIGDGGAAGMSVAEVPPAYTQSGSLELLLDLELPVSVSFGRAQLPLKDVIKLTTGSIVELNRTVTEPVEVIVNNCVIARGEVVVVEGNFGVRILQVISRQERLRTLD